MGKLFPFSFLFFFVLSEERKRHEVGREHERKKDVNLLEEKSCGAAAVPRLRLDAHPAPPREPGSKVTSSPSSAGGVDRLRY